MISHYRQSEVSFWLIVAIGVSVLAAAIGLIGAAGTQVASLFNQPSCGCTTVVISKALMAGGGVGLLLIGWMSVTTIRLIRQTHAFVRTLNVVTKTAVYRVIKDDRAVAFTAGLFESQIYLSTGLLARLSDSERQAVVRHEHFHQERFDPLRIAITETIQRTFRWLPGMTALYRHWRLTRELAADASSTTRQERSALGRSLVKLLEQPLMTTAVSAFSATEKRVRELVSPSGTMRQRQWVIPGVATLAVLIGMAYLTLQTPGAAAQGTTRGETCHLTRQCIAEQIQKQSISPVYVVCAPFSPAGGCVIVSQ